MDHEVLLGILKQDIDDTRFINLLRRLLEAGYMEDWKWNKTYSGTPQGGIISPLLANIYMNIFDRWVEEVLLPEYNRSAQGEHLRMRNPKYRQYEYLRGKAKREGDMEAYKEYGKIMRTMPSVYDDDGYRKLEYIRYADDFMFSFAGPKHEAEDIKGRVSVFLRDVLYLELFEEKTLITSARDSKARFLGYDLCVMHSQDRRTANGQIWFGVPREVRQNAKKKYMRGNKPIHKPELQHLSDYDILAKYQAEYRGLVQYYIMAHNIHKLNEVEWVVSTSLLKTLAGKHKSTVNKIAKEYRGSKDVEGRSYRVFTVTVEREGNKPLTTHFGAVPLKRNPEPSQIKNETWNIQPKRSQLVDRMGKNECEMCGAKGYVEVHHVRKLKDLNKPGRKEKPAWVQRMAAMRRKTLVICKKCHVAIHSGQSRKEWNNHE